MRQRLSPADATTVVTAEQVCDLTVDTLIERLPLGVTGYRYQDRDIFNVVVAAAAQQRSIESTCQQLRDAPSSNLVRHYLIDRLFTHEDLDAFEARCNALLVDRLPPKLLARELRIAIDLTLLPYYGKTTFVDDQLRRGEAKAGTTRFHCYATAFVLHAGRRITLALTFVYAHERVVDVLEDLLQRLRRLGVPIKELYLDREFASVAVLDLLQEQPFPSIVALPKKGKALKALLQGRRSFQTTYTMDSATDGALTFPLWVACRYRAGRAGRHGCAYLAFAVVGQRPCTMAVLQVADAYRARFGIETRYRQMHQVRVFTTSPDPAFRLFFVTVALLLTNLWVWLKAAILAQTVRADRAQARLWLDVAFRLDQYRDLLIEALKARYHTNCSLAYPFRASLPLKL